jgi:hypothetical protein
MEGHLGAYRVNAYATTCRRYSAGDKRKRSAAGSLFAFGEVLEEPIPILNVHGEQFFKLL